MSTAKEIHEYGFFGPWDDLASPRFTVSYPVDDPSPDGARRRLPREEPMGGIVIIGRQHPVSGWAHLVIAVSPQLQARGISAGRLAEEGAYLLGARGGGRPDVAQCSGPLADRAVGVILHLIQMVGSALEIDGEGKRGPEGPLTAEELELLSSLATRFFTGRMAPTVHHKIQEAPPLHLYVTRDPVGMAEEELRLAKDKANG